LGGRNKFRFKDSKIQEFKIQDFEGERGVGRDGSLGCYAGVYGFVVVEKLFMLQR